MMRAFLTCAAAALTIGASALAAGAQTPTEINFGVIPTEASVNQKKSWEPFLQAMSKATGFKMNGVYAIDYAGVIEGMRFNKVQIAWYGNKSGMEAVDRAGGEVFARIVARDGNDGYYSHIIVHKDSPFTKVEDVLKCDKSLDFGIGDPNSTSGFLVPTAYIFAARNIDPKTCFKTVRNRSRPRRDRRSLVSARAPHPRLARLGRGIRVAGVGVGAGGNVPRRRSVHGLAQHGAVRRRVSQAEFSRLGRVPCRHGRDGADRALGHRARGRVRHPVLDPERGQRLPAMDRAAGAPPDGRLPGHQRDRFRADVRGGRRSRPLRRRHGHFRSQSRGVLEAVFRSGRVHRSTAGRRHPRDRRAPRARTRRVQEVVFGVVPPGP